MKHDITIKKLVKKSGSLVAASFVCEEMIEDLKKRLSIIGSNIEKIDQYKRELCNWQKLRINCTNQINSKLWVNQ